MKLPYELDAIDNPTDQQKYDEALRLLAIAKDAMCHDRWPEDLKEWKKDVEFLTTFGAVIRASNPGLDSRLFEIQFDEKGNMRTDIEQIAKDIKEIWAST